MTWHPLETSWHDTSVSNCEVCGNLLTNGYFAIARAGQTYRACSESDADLLDLLERHRTIAAPWR